MTEQQMPAKFRITWKDGRYVVSIPNYEGGEVVRSDIAERMAEALEKCAEARMPGEARRIARESLSAFRSSTQDTEARHD